MPRLYDVKKLEHKKTPNGKVQRTEIQIKPKKNIKLRFAQIKQYYDALINSGYDSKKIAIIALGQDKMVTIKGFEADISDFGDEDYYNDRCIDKKKFDNYFFCNFRIKP